MSPPSRAAMVRNWLTGVELRMFSSNDLTSACSSIPGKGISPKADA